MQECRTMDNLFPEPPLLFFLLLGQEVEGVEVEGVRSRGSALMLERLTE